MEARTGIIPSMGGKSSKGGKGSKARGTAKDRAHVSPPREVSILEAAPDAPAVVNAGPTIADPSAVRRVLTVNGPHAGTSRVLAYRRVSTMEQMRSGTSLDAQDEEIRRYCQYARLPDPIDFEETESGGVESQEKREKIAALLKAVRPGDLVVVAKLDRFSRDIVFTISAVRDIIKRGARFLSLAERFDASTPEGETQMALWASIAQMERARIRERTEGNRKRLRALGKFVEGQPPFGYVRAKGADAHDKPRRLEIDPVKAPIVRQMFDMCLAGKSARDIALHCQTTYTGLATFRTVWILQLLKNRMYAGQIATTPVRPDKNRQLTQKPAEWVDAHEPIVSLQMWHAAQHALAGRRSYGRKPRTDTITSEWLIRGLARCSICGSMITAKPASEKNKHAGYYVCRKRYAPELKNATRERCMGAPWNRQDEIDPKIERLAARHFKALDGQLSKAPPPSPYAPNFRVQRAKLVTARSNLVSMVSSGQWGMDVIRAEAARIERDLAAIDAEERALSAEASADTVENRNGALSWLRSIVAQWGSMAVPARRGALGAMLDGIKIGPEGIAIEWSDAATMAVRYAEGRLPDPTTLDQASDDPRRPARPMLPGGAEHAPALPPGDA
ncbi:recombinase family protein [Polyangium sorediatum]|uniref:Recombinase family protein n=1 Tax=Polyangium sorediatum TaxID=889274 RepID=A0ABT6PA76_9BACT|nr:recombinase family protein [Polyangium sorediatum]MDI1437512.1 recombinase family protein [Polyangium sorediatum]